MAIPDEFRAHICKAQEYLESEGRPAGSPAIINYLRVESPLSLSPSEEECLWDAGWRSVVGQVIRGRVTEGGTRTIVSTQGQEGRTYKQLAFLFLEDAIAKLEDVSTSAHAYGVQARGWWEIVTQLRRMPEGTSVADLFPSEDRWDRFWNAIRESDLSGQQAA